MPTATGVSATDGNHYMSAGLWGEFRSLIWDHYESPDSVFTGWICKKEFAGLLDQVIDPFQLKAVDFEGNFK